MTAKQIQLTLSILRCVRFVWSPQSLITWTVVDCRGIVSRASSKTVMTSAEKHFTSTSRLFTCARLLLLLFVNCIRQAPPTYCRFVCSCAAFEPEREKNEVNYATNTTRTLTLECKRHRRRALNVFFNKVNFWFHIWVRSPCVSVDAHVCVQ